MYVRPDAGRPDARRARTGRPGRDGRPRRARRRRRRPRPFITASRCPPVRRGPARTSGRTTTGPVPWSGSARPPRPPGTRRGNYNDWSGPLERYRPAAPPSRYGAPAHYGSARSVRPGPSTRRASTAPGGEYGHYGTVRRARRAPSGRSSRPGSDRYGSGRVRPGQRASPSTARAYGIVVASSRTTPRAAKRPARVRAASVSARKLARASRCRASVSGPRLRTAASGPGTEPSGGYERGAAGPATRRRRGTRSRCSTTSTHDVPDHVDRAAEQTGSAGAGRAARQAGQARPGDGWPDHDRRSAGSITLLSLSRYAATPGHGRRAPRCSLRPQDETDPLNIVPLNIGNYS